ncbi:calcium-binding protein [Iningainema tapete]|uniref:Calcium-binding protein n=1 Tax=Iningainema tapete BLCC-T55 TaxID=2748662 RepID=A0A8J6XS44_9CYAN|nr:calcium-binding protein [Iningainema tapete]MBD2772633.1 calcium-binding protein [Iningainema tapete BLCC-T55]
MTVFNGTDGNNNFVGTSGNDIFIGSAGNDRFDGNGGSDIADYSALNQAVTILPQGRISKGGGLGTDTISEIERIIGAIDKTNVIDASSSAGGASISVNLNNENLTVNIPTIGRRSFAVENFINVIGTAEDDSITGNSDNNRLEGRDSDDTLNGGAGDDRLIGGDGNDRLTGANTLSGFGRGEIDTLTGGSGDDIFVLGAVISGSDVVFYNDGSSSTGGRGDYALITDFGFASDTFSRGEDRIQLAGSRSNYSLGASPSGLPSGTGIFFNNGTSELIGILQGVSLSSVSLTNSSQFFFV